MPPQLDSNETVDENVTPEVLPISPGVIKPVRKKKTVIILLIGLVLLLGVGAFAKFVLFKPKGESGSAQKAVINTDGAFSSPIGYIDGIEKGSSGRLSIVMKNGNMGDVVGEYNYYVRDSGRIYIELLPNVDKANAFLKSLLLKNSPGSSSISEDILKKDLYASRYVELDLASMYGYQELVSSYPDLFNLFLPLFAEKRPMIALDDSEGAESMAAASTACTSSAVALSKLIDAPKLNTLLLKPVSPVYSDGKVTFKVDTTSLAAVDSAERTFYDECYLAASQAKAADKTYYEENYARAKTDYAYTIQSSPRKLTISTAKTDPIEITILDKPATRAFDKTQPAKPLTLRQNIFAHVYDKCRSVPVVYREFTNDYKFVSADTSYFLPNAFTSAYACSLKDEVLSSADGDESIVISLGGESTITFSGASIAYLEAQHEIAYRAEQYYLKHKYYPSNHELQTGKVDGIAANYTKYISGNDPKEEGIVYKALPEDCTKCEHYTVTYNSYYPPTNNPINIIKKDYESF